MHDNDDTFFGSACSEDDATLCANGTYHKDFPAFEEIANIEDVWDWLSHVYPDAFLKEEYESGDSVALQLQHTLNLKTELVGYMVIEQHRRTENLVVVVDSATTSPRVGARWHSASSTSFLLHTKYVRVALVSF